MGIYEEEKKMKLNKENTFCLIVAVLAIAFFSLSACAGEPGSEERARVTTVDAPRQATPIPAWQPTQAPAPQPEIRYVDRVVEKVVEKPVYIEKEVYVDKPVYIDRPVERVVVEEYPVFIPPPAPPMPMYVPDPAPALFGVGFDFNVGFGHRPPRYQPRYDSYDRYDNYNYRPRYQQPRYQQRYDRYDRHYDRRPSYRPPQHRYHDDCDW